MHSVLSALFYVLMSSAILLIYAPTGAALRLLAPDVLLFTFTCVLWGELFRRGHYSRIADRLGVSKVLALIFSLLLTLAVFVGQILFRL